MTRSEFSTGLMRECELCAQMMRVAKALGETEAAEVYRETGISLAIAGITLHSAPPERWTSIRDKVRELVPTFRDGASKAPKGSGVAQACTSLAEDLESLTISDSEVS